MLPSTSGSTSVAARKAELPVQISPRTTQMRPIRARDDAVKNVKVLREKERSDRVISA